MVLPALACWLTSVAVLASSVQTATIVAAATGVAACLVGMRSRRAAATLAAATLAATAVVAMVSAAKMHSVATNPVAEAAAHGRFVTVSALVASDPRRIGGAMARSSYFRATVKRIDSTDGPFGVRAPVLVFTSEPVDRLTVGSRVVIRGTVRAARSSDLSAEVGARTIAPAADPAWWWTSSSILRDSVADATIRGPPASRALVPALVHGDDQRLSAELVDDFQRSGLTHLLAVSGTNLTIVLGAVLLMGRAAGIRGRGQWLLGLTAVAAFVLLARPEPSVLRAAAMGVVALAALGSRSRGGLRALCWAVIALLIIDPWLGTRAGFGLSVCATAGIIVLAPPWVETLTRWMPRWAAFAVAIPLAAQLACTPLVAAISSEVSLVAVLANMLAAPAVAPATVLGLAGGVVALVSSPAGQLIGLLATLCTHWIALVGHWAAGLPGASAPWTGSLALLVVMCAVAAMVMRQLLRRPPVVAGLCVVLVVVVWRPIDPGWPPRGWFMVTCDVGQGDGSVLNLGEGRAIVVDTGMERRPIERCLDRLRVRHVPLLVFSHSDADHVQGWKGVVEGRRVDRVAVGVSGGPAVPGAARVVMAPGERYRVDDVAVSVLGRRPATSTSAGEPPGESANNASLVLMVRTRGVRILLTGDIEAEAQRALLGAERDLRADVFKVPHHGSPNQDPRLFAAARARFATVSAGRDNDYGHPSPRTLSLISRHGMTPLRNDRSGDIALVLADGDISAVSQ